MIKKIFQRDMAQRYLLGDSPFKGLNLGCGKHKLKNWYNADIKSWHYVDAAGRFPMPDNSFDFIYCGLLFDELKPSQLMNCLDECSRILKPDGRMRAVFRSARYLEMLGSKKQKPPCVKRAATKFGSYQFFVENELAGLTDQVPYDTRLMSMMAAKSGLELIGIFGIGASTSEALKNIESIDKTALNELKHTIVELKPKG
jgi:ubiquinone/menaquinone biosynthesis C-methylase UbiE